jgi:predicted Fe-S protein YdhL (DUF1289 family)
MICPHCGKQIETQQRKAAASRWAGMTAEERSAEMSRIRKKGIKKRGKTKRAASKANSQAQPREASS